MEAKKQDPAELLLAGLVALVVLAIWLPPAAPGLLVGGLAIAVALQVGGLRWTWSLPATALVIAPLLVFHAEALSELAALRGQFGQVLHGRAGLGQISWVPFVAWALPFAFAGGGAIKFAWERQATLEGGSAARALARQLSIRDWVRRARQVRELRRGETEGVLLGLTASRFPFVLAFRVLVRHVLILGGTGFGKTVTLLRILTAAVHAGHAAIVVDLKASRDLAERLRRIAKETGRPFLLWEFDPDPAEATHFDCLAGLNPTEAKDGIIAGQEFSEPHYRAQAELYTLHALRVAHAAGIPLTLRVLAELLLPERLGALLRRVPDEALRMEVATYLESLTRDQRSAVRGLASRVGILTVSEASGPYLEPGARNIDLLAAIRSGAIVCFSLDANAYGSLAPQVGTLVIQALKAACGGLERRGESVRAIFAIDEFPALAGDHIEELLSRARSAGIGVVICAQSVWNLRRIGEHFLGLVLDIVGTKIVHNLADPDAADLIARSIGTDEISQYTHQTLGLAGVDTGLRSRRRVEQFRVHPAVPKDLPLGRALVVVRGEDGQQFAVVDIDPDHQLTKGAEQ